MLQPHMEADILMFTSAPPVGDMRKSSVADGGAGINGESDGKSRKCAFRGLSHLSIPDFCDRDSFTVLDVGDDSEAEHEF